MQCLKPVRVSSDTVDAVQHPLCERLGLSGSARAFATDMICPITFSASRLQLLR